MGVKRPEGLIGKAGCSGSPGPSYRTPSPPLNCLFPHKMSPTKPNRSAESSWQPEWTQTLQTIKVTTVMQENPVQLRSRLWLTPGSGPPRRRGASLPLPLTPFPAPRGSCCPRLGSTVGAPNAFLPHPRRQVPARLRFLAKARPENHFTPRRKHSDENLRDFHLVPGPSLWLYPDMAKTGTVSLQARDHPWQKLRRCVTMGPSKEKWDNTVNTG